MPGALLMLVANVLLVVRLLHAHNREKFDALCMVACRHEGLGTWHGSIY